MATQAVTQLKALIPASLHQVLSILKSSPNWSGQSLKAAKFVAKRPVAGSQYYSNYPTTGAGSGQYDYGLQYGETDRFAPLFWNWVKLNLSGIDTFAKEDFYKLVTKFRQDVSLFTFPMVITAFFSAMMGGLLAPLVVNVAAR